MLKNLSEIVDQALRTDPSLARVQHRYRQGEIDQDQATREILETLARDPNVLAAIEALRPEGEKTRLPRIDPLIEAAIIERAQFDGDIPEWRTGPLLPGTDPAVPVQMTARNPVAGGRMLQRASDEMKSEIERHEQARLEAAGLSVDKALPIMEAVGEVLAKTGEPDIQAIVWGKQETDHPEYRRGHLPALRKTVAPSGSELARLTPEEAREAAWKLLSTTQGRRSAQPVIEDLLVTDLRKHGFKVIARPPTDTEEVPLTTHEWALNLSGKRNTQQAFSFIDMAAKVLSAGIRSKLPPDTKTLTIEVAVVSRISDRIVGWSARVFP